ncbi:MAG: hypothetical protein HRU17_20300 [Polyangiaceae bacterium]|nr:hypothetical protein [Polyangiaceae bacterium]
MSGTDDRKATLPGGIQPVLASPITEPPPVAGAHSDRPTPALPTEPPAGDLPTDPPADPELPTDPLQVAALTEPVVGIASAAGTPVTAASEAKTPVDGTRTTPDVSEVRPPLAASPTPVAGSEAAYRRRGADETPTMPDMESPAPMAGPEADEDIPSDYAAPKTPPPPANPNTLEIAPVRLHADIHKTSAPSRGDGRPSELPELELGDSIPTSQRATLPPVSAPGPVMLNFYRWLAYTSFAVAVTVFSILAYRRYAPQAEPAPTAGGSEAALASPLTATELAAEAHNPVSAPPPVLTGTPRPTLAPEELEFAAEPEPEFVQKPSVAEVPPATVAVPAAKAAQAAAPTAIAPATVPPKAVAPKAAAPSSAPMAFPNAAAEQRSPVADNPAPPAAVVPGARPKAKRKIESRWLKESAPKAWVE